MNLLAQTVEYLIVDYKALMWENLSLMVLCIITHCNLCQTAPFVLKNVLLIIVIIIKGSFLFQVMVLIYYHIIYHYHQKIMRMMKNFVFINLTIL